MAADDVFKSRQFARWAKGENLTDSILCLAAREIEHGLFDAKLGGFLVKKRIAKDHKGKSGGLRTIVAYRRGQAGLSLRVCEARTNEH